MFSKIGDTPKKWNPLKGPDLGKPPHGEERACVLGSWLEREVGIWHAIGWPLFCCKRLCPRPSWSLLAELAVGKTPPGQRRTLEVIRKCLAMLVLLLPLLLNSLTSVLQKLGRCPLHKPKPTDLAPQLPSASLSFAQLRPASPCYQTLRPQNLCEDAWPPQRVLQFDRRLRRLVVAPVRPPPPVLEGSKWHLRRQPSHFFRAFSNKYFEV